MKALIIRLLIKLYIILPYGEHGLYRFNLLNPFGYVVLIIAAVISSVYGSIEFIYITVKEAIKVERDLMEPGKSTPIKPTKPVAPPPIKEPRVGVVSDQQRA
jgi:hypothetical protein